MSDLPKFVHIYEQGPREGFQIESARFQTWISRMPDSHLLSG